MYRLSAIIPIGRDFQDFNQLLSWAHEALSQKIEIILVRDSMSDESKSKFDEILSPIIADEGAVLLDISDRSPGVARNSGIDLSRGKWISFWDCDDFPIPKSVLSELDKVSDETQVIIGQYKVNGIQKTTKDLVDVAINPGNWRFVYRRDFVGSRRFTTENWGEDQLFILESRALAAQVTISDLVFYDYQSGGTENLTSDKRNAPALESILDKAIRLSSKQDMSSIESMATCIMILRMSLTMVRKSKSTRKVRAVFLFIVNNFRLVRNFRRVYLYAYFNLWIRIRR
jgi:glycosyltransferase involved in cell wall biosynthesis